MLAPRMKGGQQESVRQSGSQMAAGPVHLQHVHTTADISAGIEGWLSGPSVVTVWPFGFGQRESEQRPVEVFSFVPLTFEERPTDTWNEVELMKCQRV